MKRHKYKLNKIEKRFNTKFELQYLAAKFLKKRFLPFNRSLSWSCSSYLSSKDYHISRINTYCLITGRTRFTIKNTLTSRQLFFENTRSGKNCGFFLN